MTGQFFENRCDLIKTCLNCEKKMGISWDNYFYKDIEKNIQNIQANWIIFNWRNF